MVRVEFLLEEPSMVALLEILLPRILSAEWQLNVNYFLRPHEGKQDLHKSIPRKMRVFSNTTYEKIGVIIMQDQDSNDCKELKSKLLDYCKDSALLPCAHLVRIVCRELESWYIGDLEAVEAAYPNFNATKYKAKAKYRVPDNLTNAAEEFEKLLPEFQKTAAATAIGAHLNIENNKSTSFQQFVSGVQKFFQELSHHLPR